MKYFNTYEIYYNNCKMFLGYYAHIPKIKLRYNMFRDAHFIYREK